jgi:hypothetical protein
MLVVFCFKEHFLEVLDELKELEVAFSSISKMIRDKINQVVPACLDKEICKGFNVFFVSSFISSDKCF